LEDKRVKENKKRQIIEAETSSGENLNLKEKAHE